MQHLNSIEQALQEVVSSKQCIWKSWLLAVEFSGHMLDLQTSSTTVLREQFFTELSSLAGSWAYVYVEKLLTA